MTLDFFSPSTSRKHLVSPEMNYPFLGLIFLYEDDQESVVGQVVGDNEASIIFKVLQKDLKNGLKVSSSKTAFNRQEMVDLVEHGARLLLFKEKAGVWGSCYSFDNTL
ncbi:MAG: hypothetical protein LBG52_04995 [Candidatus Peribacteria bacterium]|nr:hypothetical protein [Candidatus Peribacteria bacterium]